MLDISHSYPRSDDSELLLELSGRLDSEGVPRLQQILETISDEVDTLILDMGDLEYLSSSGLRALLQAHKLLAGRNGRLLLIHLPPFLEQVLELSGMANVFSIADSLQEALARSTASLVAPWSCETELGKFAFVPLQGDPCHLELWEEGRRGELFQSSLEELGVCLGYGGFGKGRDQARENMGLFFSDRTVAALLPDGPVAQPLFLTTRYPKETVLFLSRGVSVSGSPVGCLQVDTPHGTSLERFLQELDRLLPAPGGGDTVEACLPRVCMLFATDIRPSAQDGSPAAGALILCIYYRGRRDAPLPSPLASLPWQRDGELNCCAVALSLRVPPEPLCGNSPMEGVGNISEADKLFSFFETGPDTQFQKAKAWVWNPGLVRSAREKLLNVHCQQDLKLAEVHDSLTRRVFTLKKGQEPAVSRLELFPLRGDSGCNEAGVYLVRRYTEQGTALPPALLELDSEKRITRERDAFRQYVHHHLQLLDLSLENVALQEGQGALHYGFPGRENGDFALSSLAQLYPSLPMAELLPLFDTLFTRLLKPWYGHPKPETIHPWQEHNPLPHFPDILDAAQRELGLSPDSEGFDSPELGRRVRNPFHVLAHEFPARRHEAVSWYSSIVHGDLHLHNVLLDDRQQLHLIGYHATKRGNVVTDMARLEPVLLLEYARLANESEMDALARFMETWYAAPSYAAVPPFGYSGSDPRISKAYQLLRRLRSYADTVTLFETDLRPYLLAVLQWTLPVVTCGDWEPERKRLAAIMGGVVCEQVLGEGV